MEKWTFVDELPCLNILHICVVSEHLFIRLISPELWGQARVDFTTNSGKRVMSEEIIPMGIIITDRVGEESLGMVTIFCCSDQQRWSLQLCFWPYPVGFTSASHGGDENLYQLTLFPSGVHWPPLPGCSHPVRGYLNHLISIFMAAPALAAPVFCHSGHPA